MSALAPDSVDPTDLTVPYYDLALSLLITMQSLATYSIDPSSIYLPPNMAVINGGFGSVQQGILRLHDGSTIAVAVKKLRPAGNEIQRLRTAVALAREVKVWAGLHHPNIATLFGYHLDMRYDCAWLISGWEPFGDIKGYLASTQPDQETRLRLVIDTARGLAYLHNRSPAVCHGDIKLANILVNANRTAMWCDFGLAQAMDSVPSGLTTSRTNTGTTRYLSAEVLNGQSGKTLKADVWAWGCVFLEVMTDRIPYESERSDFSVVLAIAQGKLPAAINNLPIPDFGRQVLEKCWSPEATSRPTMTWCSEVLSRQTPALFTVYYKECRTNIPSEYMSEGDGWCQIRNPDSEKLYEFELLPSLQDNPNPYFGRFAFSPDGRSVAVVEDMPCKTLRLYDVKTGQMRSTLDPSRYGHVFAVSFSHSSSLLATGHTSGVIRIWDPETWKLKCALKGHRMRVSSITFSSSDAILASISRGEVSIRTWNVQNGTPLQVIPATWDWNMVSSFHHPFVLTFSVNKDTVNIYDAELGCYHNQTQSAGPAIFMPDGAGFISVSATGSLTTWDMRPVLKHRERISNGEISSLNRDEPKLSGTTIEGPQDCITALSVSSDGQLLASGSRLNDDCVLWDLTNRRPLLRMCDDTFGNVSNVSFQPGSTISQGILAYTCVHLSGYKLQLLRYKLTS